MVWRDPLHLVGFSVWADRSVLLFSPPNKPQVFGNDRADGGPWLLLNGLLLSIKGGTVYVWAAQHRGDFLVLQTQQL